MPELYKKVEISERQEGNVKVTVMEHSRRVTTEDEESMIDIISYIAESHEGDLYDSGWGYEGEDNITIYLSHFTEHAIKSLKGNNLWGPATKEEKEEDKKESARIDEMWLKAKPVIEKLQKEGWETYTY